MLSLIRNQLGGILATHRRKTGTTEGIYGRWQLRNIKKLMEMVLPMLIKFPLKSKKAKEFESWRKVVEAKYISNMGGYLDSLTPEAQDIFDKNYTEIMEIRHPTPEDLEKLLKNKRLEYGF